MFRSSSRTSNIRESLGSLLILVGEGLSPAPPRVNHQPGWVEARGNLAPGPPGCKVAAMPEPFDVKVVNDLVQAKSVFVDKIVFSVLRQSLIPFRSTLRRRVPTDESMRPSP